LFSDTSSLEPDFSNSSEASEPEEKQRRSRGIPVQPDWPSVYSCDRDTKSIHWLNPLAYNNRIINCHLSEKETIRNIMDLENSTFIPSPGEHSHLNNEFVVLVLRILTKQCKYFQQFANIVPAHIPHQYRRDMSYQPQVVRA